jgi:putative phage-type endonuclease
MLQLLRRDDCCPVCQDIESGKSVPIAPVLRIMKDDGPKQKSADWDAKRTWLITGSQVSSVLGKNFHESHHDLFLKKIRAIRRIQGIEITWPYYPLQFHSEYAPEFPGEFQGNIYTKWGEKYEDEAMQLYSNISGHTILNPSLIPHPEHPDLLGASPDGVTLCGRVIEIKCPYKAPIPTNPRSVPKQYEDQVQAEMHCCDMHVCDFIRYRPPHCSLAEDGTMRTDDPDVVDPVISILEVKRDPNWFRDNYLAFKIFHDALMRATRLQW